jgi:hypothetical protein
VNDILIQKLNKEIELEIERERDFQMWFHSLSELIYECIK